MENADFQLFYVVSINFLLKSQYNCSMNNFTITVKNSYCEIAGQISYEVENLIYKILTTHNDIEAEVSSIFYRMKMLKRYGVKRKDGESVEANQTRARQSMHVAQAQLEKLKASEYVYWYQNKKFPTGHLNIVKDLLGSLNIKYNLSDIRKRIDPHIRLKWKRDPLPLRYYQKEMVDLGLKEGRGVMVSAVGTGKTLIMEYLIKELSVVSLVIVPSAGLRSQVYDELVDMFGTRSVQKIEGAQIRKGGQLKPIRVVTIQTVAALQKTNDLHLLISDVEAMFVDEIHHSGSASYTNILPYIDHIYWKFGFTGTFLCNDSKSLDMWGFLSTEIYNYPAWKAIEDGFLTPIEVVTYDLRGVAKSRYPKEYDENYCGKSEILRAVIGIVNSTSPNDQILILVNRKDKAGAVFHEALKAQGIENAYISGDDKVDVITQTIKDFNDKKVKILIGSSVIGEGIDVRSTGHLIMAQGQKSEIVIVQAIGRLVRLFEGKKVGIVHDFNFTGTKYMEKHFELRKDIIERNFQPQKWTNL